MNRDEFQNAADKLVTRAGADEAFKAKLLADPTTVLKENEITAPEGMDVRVVENTDTTVRISLSPPPSSDELAENELDLVVGAGNNVGGRGPF